MTLSTTPPPGYPLSWEADVVLRDGSTCQIRPISPDDRDGLITFHSQLSEETVYYRFFALYPRLSTRDLERFTHVDYHRRAALVATVRDELIGVVRYEGINDTDAEVAFVIRDDHQGRGLGTIFLEHIAQAARERGFRRFVAEVLPDNDRMLEIFKHAGYTPTSEYDEGVVRLEFDIRPTVTSLEVSRAREQRAEALSVGRLLRPTSVAVVGASREPGSVGRAFLSHLVDGGFTGRIFAVNPNADTIAGVPSFPTLSAIDEHVDLALVAVPAAAVAAVIDDAGKAGIYGLVVVSSGFAEIGPIGRDVQQALVRSARVNGMRLVGPNALGLINTDPQIALNASMSPVVPERGPLGFFSQSGALGVALLSAATQRGLGLSTFVSAGNRADISGNDLLQYWEDDESTEVVMLYLESIGNPRKFSRIARRLGHHKPVIAVRAGRSTQGYPLGHTMRESVVPPEAVEQMFRQAGVIRTDTIAQMFDVAQLAASQPYPAGSRVLSISNSDAMTVMAADAVDANGLEWVEPPIDFPFDATASAYERALAGAMDDPAVDSVLMMFVPALNEPGEQIVNTMIRVANRSAKPIVAVLFGVEGTHGLLRRGIDAAAVPRFQAVEDAVRALAGVTRYAEWRRTEVGSLVDPPGIDVDRARALVIEWLRESPNGLVLSQDNVSYLLSCYGIAVWQRRVVRSTDEAVAAAQDLGYPVVLKTADSHLRLRSDLGGIYFDVDDDEELRRQFDARLDDLKALDYDRLVVQRQAEPGASVVLEAMEDPLFGPVISFGLSGVAYDVLHDRAFGIPPMTETDVDQLLSDPRASSLLDHDHEGRPLNLEPLRQIVARLSRLVDDLPEVCRLTMRPIVVATTGASVLGAYVEIRPPVGRVDVPARRLLG